MSFRHRLRALLRPGGLGLLLAALALAGQVLLGAAVLPDAAAAAQAQIAALGVICHADAPGQPPARHHHHPSGCTLCPLCAAMATQAVMPAAGPDVPPPAIRPAGHPALPPPARAPPSQPRRAAWPRGPPVPT